MLPLRGHNEIRRYDRALGLSSPSQEVQGMDMSPCEVCSCRLINGPCPDDCFFADRGTVTLPPQTKPSVARLPLVLFTIAICLTIIGAVLIGL